MSKSKVAMRYSEKDILTLKNSLREITRQFNDQCEPLTADDIDDIFEQWEDVIKYFRKVSIDRLLLGDVGLKQKVHDQK